MRVNPFMVLAAFAADFGRLSPLLDPGVRRALGDRLAELRAAGPDQEPAADRAARTLLDALPAEEAARLRQDGGGQGRFVDASDSAQYEGFAAADLCMLVLDGNPMIGPVLGPVRERLLAQPASQWWRDADPRLIALSGEDGRRRLPLFQFEAGTMPWRIVLEVNTVLRADIDPWGAADWWLSRTTWWDGTPAGLLGRDRDAELLGAAQALAAVDGAGE
ncbi:hypothetical protein OG864_13700 [Streptomyces sp. NBC_00124]|uniref:hypothetical protein n=1 Tax=Streptomyces sp. NBC_00124 TaxID=2975662 RepID=UPI002258AFD6|nr:hypothetical protein [Streptomyces sp. NBC_00124]MCX5359755.1 hypothetical protein [Streptomyces sp. NBC_00124]